MSAGGTVVVGSDADSIDKMLRTLYFFTPETMRWCTLSSTAPLAYSPYIRLQGCTERELPQVLTEAVLAPHAICIINLNTRRVRVLRFSTNVSLSQTVTCCTLEAHAHKRKEALRRQLLAIVGNNPNKTAPCM